MCGGSRARTGNYNDGCDPEHVVEFVTVSSDFYPELRAYYTEEAKEWPARLEGWATVTTRPCCRIACPTWHRRVSKRYPRPPLPVRLAAAGFAASRLASVIARSRRTRARFLRKCGNMGMFGVQTCRRFGPCSRGCAGPCAHERYPWMHYGPFATCEDALSVASGLIRGGVREHDDAETSLILKDGTVIAVVSPRRS